MICLTQPAELPTVAELEAEFWRLISDPHSTRKSWYEATELVKQQIAWLEYVPEPELSNGEVDHLLSAYCKAFVALRRLTARYID